MDKCKKFKDIILTDYIDGEINPAIKVNLESHLLACPDCRAFADQVKADLVTPFEKTTPEPVPAHLWAAIKEQIEVETPLERPVWDRISEWFPAFSLPRFAPAVMGLLVFAVVGSSVFQQQQIKQAKEKEQGVYLASLLDSTAASSDVDTDNSATPIETYFL